MKSSVPSYLLQSRPDENSAAVGRRSGLSFLDKTILNSAEAVKTIYLQAENAEKDNFIYKVNPHVKLISLIYIAIVISIVSNPVSQIFITAFIFSLYLFARIRVFEAYRKIFLLAFIFGFLVVLPASLNLITHGTIVFNILTLDRPYQFWIYNIPREIGITTNGIQVVLLVFLRVLNSVAFAMLIIFTTPFPSFIKSFKIIGVPDTFLMIISLAYKYIFILSRTIEDTYFALKSRLSGNISRSSLRKLISGRIFFIFKKSVIIYENTYYAMVSRGYHGKVKLHSQHHFAFSDFIVLIIIGVIGLAVILL